MNHTRVYQLGMLTLIVFIGGCGKVAQEQEAHRLFGKAEYKQAIRTVDSILDETRDKDLAYEMKVLKGRCLIHLADRARKSANEDSAITNLEQAVIVLTTAIEFRGDEHEAFYQRAIAYEMLGNTDEAYADTVSAKRMDPAHKIAYTNDVHREDLSDETRLHELREDRGESTEHAPIGLLAEKDERLPADDSNEQFANNRTDSELDAYAQIDDPSNKQSDPNLSDESYDDPRNSRSRQPGYVSEPAEEDLENEDGNLGPVDPNEDGSFERPRRRRGSAIARIPDDELQPLDPDTPEAEENDAPWQNPLLYPRQKTPRSVMPIPLPSTGISGNHSRLRPNFNPSMPTTGYSGGQPNSHSTGLAAPSAGVAGLANGPAGPTTGYSGSPYASGNGIPGSYGYRAPSYRSPSTGGGNDFTFNPSLPNGQFGYSGALPYAQRRKLGQDPSRITTPYHAPQRANDPYSHVPQARTMKDFYTPPAYTPHTVPTTSIYGQ